MLRFSEDLSNARACFDRLNIDINPIIRKKFEKSRYNDNCIKYDKFNDQCHECIKKIIAKNINLTNVVNDDRSDNYKIKNWKYDLKTIFSYNFVKQLIEAESI